MGKITGDGFIEEEWGDAVRWTGRRAVDRARTKAHGGGGSLNNEAASLTQLQAELEAIKKKENPAACRQLVQQFREAHATGELGQVELVRARGKAPWEHGC